MAADAGGRIYFAKDSLADPRQIPAMYPDLEAWRTEAQKADPEAALATDLVRRLNLRKSDMMQTWLILGASSAMARAFARAVSAQGDCVLLAGRDMADLKATAADCLQRGARAAEALNFDTRDAEGFANLIARHGCRGRHPERGGLCRLNARTG